MKKSAISFALLAFTLIELLVVITIIAILAGIALPVYSLVMERAHATQDMSNLRQIGIGTVAYLADNNDQIFTAPAGGATSTTSWPVTLYLKYVPNWMVFKSPFDTRATNTTAPSTGTGVPVSYGINYNIYNGISANPSFDGNTTKYTSPSQLIFMAPDIQNNPTTLAFNTGDTGDQNIVLPQTIPVAQPTGANPGNLGTHAKRSLINALYADAHVASITYLNYSMAVSTVVGSAEWEPIVSTTQSQ